MSHMINGSIANHDISFLGGHCMHANYIGSKLGLKINISLKHIMNNLIY